MPIRRRLLVCAFTVFVIAPLAAHAAAPLRPRIARCTPLSLPDAQGGFGGTAAERRVGIDFGLYTLLAYDTVPLDALAATTRLEVCWTRAVAGGGTPEGACPGSIQPDGTPGNDEWVIFDNTTKPLNRQGTNLRITDKKSLGPWILPSTGKGALPEQIASVPVDWASPSNAGKIFFIRVNKETIDFKHLPWEQALAAGGFCPIVEPMGAASEIGGGDFNYFGTPNTLADPFAGALGDVCSAGNHAGAFDTSTCSDAATATFVVERMPDIGVWQTTVAMAQTMTLLDPPVWANGKCGPTPCPTNVLSFSSDGAAHGGLGQFYLWPQRGVADPLDHPDAGATLRITSHEYWHNLQAAWDRAENGAIHGQLWTEPFLESTATALESNVCFFDYPGGVAPGTCVSARRLGYNVENGEWNLWLDAPHQNLLGIPYTSSLFWRYAMEQFALTVDPANPAHPGGINSFYRTLAPGSALTGRRADEGADFLGLVIKAYLAQPQAPSLDSIDEALRKNLGRSLDAFMLDLHTAVLLKDYPDADPRWRLEWVGDYESGATSHFACAGLPAGACLYPPPPPPLAQVKATGKFPVQPDLIGPAPISDRLHRVHRQLDIYQACIGAGCAPPSPVPFGPGRVESSPQERYLDPYGATYLSAAPDPTLGTLRVRLVPRKGTQPRFRIFLVDSAGKPKAYGPCTVDADGAAPDDTERCQLNPEGIVDESIPIDPTNPPAEVLVVASSGREESRFTWTLGAEKPQVSIIDPTTSHKAAIGHPGPPDATRPFLAQLAVANDKGEPLSNVPLAAFELRVPGCAATSTAAPGCALINGTDFSVSEVGAGLYWAIGRLPADFYPAPGSLLDLAVAVTGLTTQPVEASAAQALSVQTAPEVVTQVVLDRSGSMADFGGAKWEAAKVATKLVLDGLPDGERFGLVTFNQDAATQLEIVPISPFVRTAVEVILASLKPGGATSVGDGLLEAQSNLIEAGFDVPPAAPPTPPPGSPPLPPPPPPPVLQTILLSDGISNSGYIPRRYYLYPPDAGFTDGAALPDGVTDDDPSDNKPWNTGATGQLSWPDRVNAKGLVPSVSAVAIGADAEPAELMTLADRCQGTFSFVDPVTDSVQFSKAMIQVSDAFRLSMDDATGHERTFAGTAKSLEQMPDLVVEPQAAELLVSVAAGTGGAGTLRLLSPDGTPHLPAASSGTSAVFRVASPAPGTWHFDRGEIKVIASLATTDPTAADPGATVFVESALRTPISLIVHADVARVGQPGARPEDGFEDRRWNTRPIVLRAAAVDGRPIPGVTVTAVVEPPAGPPLTVPLADDGQHSDGRASDGFYGAVLAATQRAGVYRIHLTAEGKAASGFAFHRERTLAVALHEAPDADGDHLPDVWEEEVGTDPGRADAGEDPDHDGLTNGEELQHGTQPQRSDTDGGGEADGSEVAAGRDPLPPGDDALRPFAPTWKPGSGRGLLRVPAPAGTSVEVECGPSLDGPFTAAATTPIGDGDLAVALADGQQACCRTRTLQGAAASAWSAPVCLVPGSDPYPPRLALEPANGRHWSPTRHVRVRLVASDTAEHAGGELANDPHTVTTGVHDMRVSNRVDFADAPWVPFAPEVDVTLAGEGGGSVWAQVRDGAGNESARASTSFTLTAHTPLDHAILLEEQALERMHAGAWRQARKAVRESRRLVRESLHKVRARVEQPSGDAVDRQMLRDLRRVRCWKWWARVFAHRPCGSWAIRKLEKALAVERRVADLALEKGRPL